MPPSPPRPGRDGRLGRRTRRILHLDVDAFLASVEQVVHPELAGKALVIGGSPDSRNLVMSSSYEARAYGVRPGMSLREAARRCPQAIFRDGDAQAANRLRERTTRLLMEFTPLVEVASIDDFFLDLSGCARLFGDAFATAEEIRRRVKAEVGLPLTVGIGTSRTLARLAGKLAKPGGVAEVLPGHELAFLAPLPLEHLPGVGHATGALLERFGLRTVGELRRVPREVLFATLGSAGLVLFERAHGRDDEPVEPTYRPLGPNGALVPRTPRSIQRVSTFEPEEGAREQIEAMLAYVVERAAHHLRSLGLVAGSLEVHVQYVDTRPPSLRRLEPDEGAARRARRTLDAPSDSTDELLHQARALLRSLPRRRALVKRIGIGLWNLRRSPGWQGTLFADPAADRAPSATPERGPHGSRADRQRRLDGALDELRTRFGFGRVLRGSSLPLLEGHELGPDGIRLRTPSLNQ